MYTILTCNGYRQIGKTDDPEEALRIAREHVDGTYDCIIMQDGRIVGDKSGFGEIRPEPIRDHATLTGMYDRED